MRTRTTLALAISLISSAGVADERTIEEEIVVTANRTEKPLSTIPNTVTLIDQEELAEQLSATSDLSTVLGNLIPGFSPARQKMTNSGESLRGRKPLYMIDGVPQSNPLRNGGRDGHTIDPLMLERVEVIHGANAIHGMGASGGIINLVTREPSNEVQQSLRLESALQPEDTGDSLGYSGSYSLSGQFDSFDLLGSVTYRDTGLGYDANGDVIGFDNTQGDTMDSETVNAFVKIGHNWDDQRLELTLNRYELSGSTSWVSVDGDWDAGIPTTAEEGTVPGKSPSNEATTVNLQYSNEDLFGQKLRVQAFSQDFAGTYGATDSNTFQDLETYGETIYDQSQNNSEKRGVKITLIADQLAGAPVNLTYGLDLLEDKTWQQLILTNRTWVPKTRYESVAPYAQLEFSGIDRLAVTAGLRREISRLKVDDFTTLAKYGSQSVEGGEPEFSETLSNLGATYQLNDAWRLFANYAEGYSMPDVGRALRGIDQPGQDVESFLNLTPIITDNEEIGIEYSGARLAAQVTYYRSDSDFGQRLQADPRGIYTLKREKTEIDGLEFRGQWFANENDTLELRYAQTDGQSDSDGDGKVDRDQGGADIAPSRANLSWSRAWSDRLSTRLQANWLLSRDFKDGDGNTYSEFDGYTTIDLSANLQALGGDFTLGVQNLTNEDYFTYYSQTFTSVAYQNTRNFKGLGRSVNLSYSRLF